MHSKVTPSGEDSAERSPEFSISHSPAVPTETAVAVRPEITLSSSRSGWFVIAGLLLIELVSFHRMVIRDVEGLYPFSFDQGVYLMQAYEAFETIRTDGISAGLRNALFSPGRPTGVLVQGEAALAYVLFGASRTTSLLVLFAHFAALQVILFAAFRRITHRNAPGFIAIALLLFSISRFFYAGGLNDFRFDSPAACLYGISLLSFLCCDQFRNRSWTIIFAASLTALITTRFVSASYSGIAIVLSVAVYSIQDFQENRDAASVWLRIRAASLVCGASAAAAALLIIPNASNLISYYLEGHFTGPEKSIRAAEQGVFDRTSALLFYPRSLALDHLGISFLLLSLLVVALAIASRSLAWSDAEHAPPEQRRRSLVSLIIAGIWILIPLALFTFDEAKSPVVAGVMVVPVVVAICCLYLLISGRSNAGRRFTAIELGVATLLIAISCAYSLSLNSRRQPNLQMAKDATELYASFDEIAAEIRRSTLKQPKIATDSILDYFNGPVVKVMTYERTGRLVDTQELLASTIMAIPKSVALAAMEKADFAMVTISHPSVERHSVYPFQASIIEYRKDLLAYARTQMLPMRTVQVADHVFQLFQRPRIEVMGISGDWLPNTGASLRVRVADLRKFPYVLLSGATMLSRELRGKLRCDAYLLSADSRERLPLATSAYLGNDEYAIAINASATISRPEETIEIALEFPTYFVPIERGINADTRKLAVSSPTATRLIEGPASFPPKLAESLKALTIPSK